VLQGVRVPWLLMLTTFRLEVEEVDMLEVEEEGGMVLLLFAGWRRLLLLLLLLF
jgi:hypothetical protein